MMVGLVANFMAAGMSVYKEPHMKPHHRRRFLQLTASCVALPAISRFARAQAYPARPVRVLIGFPAGGVFDVIARIMADWLSAQLGQPFVVENRPGAGSNVATEAAARATADGYTLLAIGSPNAINASLYDKLNYDFVHDIMPIASTVRLPNILQVNLSVPAMTVPELIAYAKANPEPLSVASAGNGTSGHLSAELFKSMTGVNMIHVPYRGGPAAFADLMSGRVHVMFDALANSLQLIKAGKLRALAVTTASRIEILPDLPTVGDFVPGYEASLWNGLGAPKGTAPEIIDKLNREINAALLDPTIKARLAALGGSALPGDAADFERLIALEIKKWAKVVKSSGAKPG
jgi:tripartite-type tricarboxylate transporter receptor subunit TctC